VFEYREDYMVLPTNEIFTQDVVDLLIQVADGTYLGTGYNSWDLMFPGSDDRVEVSLRENMINLYDMIVNSDQNNLFVKGGTFVAFMNWMVVDGGIGMILQHDCPGGNCTAMHDNEERVYRKIGVGLQMAGGVIAGGSGMAGNPAGVALGVGIAMGGQAILNWLDRYPLRCEGEYRWGGEEEAGGVYDDFGGPPMCDPMMWDCSPRVP
jgi:hypothetical protein